MAYSSSGVSKGAFGPKTSSALAIVTAPAMVAHSNEQYMDKESQAMQALFCHIAEFHLVLEQLSQHDRQAGIDW